MEVINIDTKIISKKYNNLYIKSFYGKNEFNYINFKNEILISLFLNNKKISPNIKGIYINKNSYSIFFEAINGVDLSKYKINELSLNDKLILFKKILLKIKKLHNLGIIHNDLNLKNILITRRDVFIIDFSESEFLKEKKELKKYISFTKYYSPIESYSSLKKYTPMTDTYSLTSIFYYIVFEKNYNFKFNFFEIDFDFNNTSIKIIKFIKKGLNKNPYKRFQNIDEMIKKIEELDERI